jgi:hypothetical protein
MPAFFFFDLAKNVKKRAIYVSCPARKYRWMNQSLGERFVPVSGGAILKLARASRFHPSTPIFNQTEPVALVVWRSSAKTFSCNNPL